KMSDLPGRERIGDVDKAQALREPGKWNHRAAQTLRWLMAPAHRRLWASVAIEPSHLKRRNRHRLPLDGDVVDPSEGRRRRPQLRHVLVRHHQDVTALERLRDR